MTEHFVTLFDHLFIPQGLALHASMLRHCRDFTLWIVCVDNEAYSVLSRLNLERTTLMRLSEWESPELLKVKSGRTRAEYCWTLTPQSVRFVFEQDPDVSRVTYLDADTWFRGSPKPIFDELERSKKSVLITEHGYSPDNDQSFESGRYCVQFITFYRDKGESVRSWWEKRCLEWCFARYEDGRFGDQKYLDDWPTRFSEQVHVLRIKALVMGPWSATRFPYSESVIWHFHGVRLKIKQGRIAMMWSGGYPLPLATRKHVYEAYLADLRSVVSYRLKAIGYRASDQYPPAFATRVAYFLRGCWRATWKCNSGISWH